MIDTREIRLTDDATLGGIEGKGGVQTDPQGRLIEGHGLWWLARSKRNPEAFDLAWRRIREWFEAGGYVEYQGPLAHDGQTKRVAVRVFLRAVSRDFPWMGEDGVTVQIESTGQPKLLPPKE